MPAIYFEITESVFFMVARIVSVVLLLQAVIACVGNGLLIAVTLRSKTLRTSCFILIAVQAAADCLRQGHKLIITYYSFTEITATVYGCYFVNLATMLAMDYCTILMLFIAVDRFIAAKFPVFYVHRTGRKYVTAVLLCCLIYTCTFKIMYYNYIVSETRIFCTTAELQKVAGNKIWFIANTTVNLAVIVIYMCLTRVTKGDRILDRGKAEHRRPPNVLVIRGQPVKLGDIPYQALIVYSDSRNETGDCGGSLISTRHVLTSAQCATRIEEATVVVGAVNINYLKHAEVRKVRKITIHPQFSNDENYYNDIAILELDIAVSLTRNIKLSNIYRIDSEYFKHKTAIVSGFGSYEPGSSEHSKLLVAANVTIFPFEYCNKVLNGRLEEGQQFCAGAKGTGIGPKDRGGPIHVLHSANLVQIGISSYTANVTEQHEISSVFTRVSHYCDYINEVTEGAAKCQ
ncbi:hypothetical protein QR680_014516 [Steinernema hermaphroditum]|uniref:Peptidase S1 domain-containing protein n=1 Tax=Steinernema hermaphroditum TaxID=289476 RepID=A0AA39IAR6_9BILA|nr:hypothetical protein QR680_014516 [Steinernema hermaphroditum]